MPELPEVETVVRALKPVLTGRHIVSCDVHCKQLRFPFHAQFQNILSNTRVESVERRGKYMVLTLCGDHVLIWHLGMSGVVKIVQAGQDYEFEKHDHVVLHTDDGGRVIFNDPRRFGFMEIENKDGWQQSRSFKTMGPEPFDPDFKVSDFLDALHNKTCSIKVALLDQRVIAGVGNIYACEALYRSGISPKRKAGNVRGKKAALLLSSIREVLSEAIDAGGSSLRDYKHIDGSLGYFQHHFSVYDREGQICKICLDKDEPKPCIKRIVQSGRSTFYCSKTQR